MNELEQLLAMLGVKTFAEAAASITNFNAFLEAACTAAGTKDTAAALAAVQARASFGAALQTACGGKTGDEAIGLVRAALASHAELPKAQARVVELEGQVAENAKKEEQHTLEALITTAKAAKKCTPAMEKSVREAFEKKEVTLAGAKAWLENAPAVPALVDNKTEAPPPAAGAANSGEPLKHNGKTWAEMTGPERVALKRSQPDLYTAMRKAAGLN